MLNRLTITFTPPLFPPAGGYRVKYRIAGSTDDYTEYMTAVTTSPIIIEDLDGSVTGYEGTVESNCGGGTFSVIAEFTTNIFCNCPSGYTAVGENSNCQKVTSVAATLNPGGAINACHFSYVDYGIFGTVIYKVGGYAVDGTYTITPTFLKTPLAGGSYTGSLWGNPAVANTSKGRLNKTCIWKCGDQNYSATPLGFSRQINIPTTKTYYIGMAADNLATIKINGVTVVDQNPVALTTQLGGTTVVDAAFKFWHIYPVVLDAGINLLEITGTNFGVGTYFGQTYSSPAPGGYGFEIYDATEAELIACTTEADLIPHIVFTTADITSLPTGYKVVDNDPFDVGSYNCTAHPGYSLVYEGGSYYCKLIENAACGSDLP